MASVSLAMFRSFWLMVGFCWFVVCFIHSHLLSGS